jgi:hypothetical protein
MATRTTTRTRDYSVTASPRRPVYSLGEGAIGGLVGGVLMGMGTMLLFWVLGQGFWLPMKLIATLLMDASAVDDPGFELGPVLVGMMIHLALSMMFGAAMVWLGRYLPGEALVRAMVMSLVLWLVADFIVMPLIAPTFDRLMPEWIFALSHVLYGAGLGGYLLARGKRATTAVEA